MRGAAIVLTTGLFLAGSEVFGATWYVDPAGGGDFLLIQDAVNAAATRDTILLAPGVHDAGASGEIEIQGDARRAMSLVLTGAGTAEETVIRGHGSSTTTIRCGYTTPEMVIQHLTIEAASSTPQPSCAVVVNGGVTMTDCVVRGAFDVCGVTGNGISLLDCSIDVPIASYGVNGGLFARRSSISSTNAVYGGGGSVIDSCLISGTVLGIRGTGFTIRNSQITGCVKAMKVDGSLIEGCLIAANGPTDDRGVVEIGTNTRVVNCTIVGNATPRDDDLGQATVHVDGGATTVQVTNNIFAFNDAVDFRTWSHDVEFTCNLLWQNDPLSHLGIAELDGSNIVADPLFCDLAGGDYTLDAASPAATGSCGLIGAFPVGCSVVATGNAPPKPLARLDVTPNPFNPRTTVRVRLEGIGVGASLRLVDVAGRAVRRLALPAGATEASVYWDGKDDAGHVLGSGVYYAVLDGADGRLAKALVMAR